MLIFYLLSLFKNESNTIYEIIYEIKKITHCFFLLLQLLIVCVIGKHEEKTQVTTIIIMFHIEFAQLFICYSCFQQDLVLKYKYNKLHTKISYSRVKVACNIVTPYSQILYKQKQRQGIDTCTFMFVRKWHQIMTF